MQGEQKAAKSMFVFSVVRVSLRASSDPWARKRNAQIPPSTLHVLLSLVSLACPVLDAALRTLTVSEVDTWLLW